MNAPSEEAKPDFVAAETFLHLARSSYEGGDATKFVAARKLLMVALCVPDALPLKRVA